MPEADIARGDGPLVAETIETFCRISKDGLGGRAGEPMVLRGWQHILLGHLFARRPDGRMRHRTGLVGMPRKNGKSGIGSGLALDGLLFSGQGSDVFSCAGDKLQAGIVFGDTKKMVEADEELAEFCKPYKDHIEAPATNSVYRVLSSEAFTKEGLNPKRVLFDEVHVQPTDELWNVMSLAMAARVDPMLIGITTAGVMTQTDGEPTVCYRLFQYGLDVISGAVDDPSFFMAWWGAPAEDPDTGKPIDHTDPKWWRFANPGFGDLIDPEDFASKVKTTPENEFRTKRLNQWVAAAKVWLPNGAWEGCATSPGPGEVPAGTQVVLTLDGSYNNDSTGLVLATVAEVPHLDVVEAWERPKDAGEGWKVPIQEVEERIRAACRRWDVVEIACDPYRWARTIEVLEEEGLPVVTFPQSPERMIPATQRFYEAVLNDGATHSGDVRLARHIGNCRTKTDSRGSRIVKDAKASGRKIDLAVCAVMALDRAAQAAPEEGPHVW